MQVKKKSKMTPQTRGSKSPKKVNRGKAKSSLHLRIM